MLFKITERNTEELWRHQRLTQAATHYAKTLKIPRPKELDIRLLLSANKKLVEDNTHGNMRVLRDSYIDGNPHQFKVTIQSGMPWTWTLSTFAHEMVHVWQYATGMLRVRYYNGSWEDSWDGGAWIKDGSIPYVERPWEIHAKSKENWLLQSFFMVEKTGGMRYGVHG